MEPPPLSPCLCPCLSLCLHLCLSVSVSVSETGRPPLISHAELMLIAVWEQEELGTLTEATGRRGRLSAVGGPAADGVSVVTWSQIGQTGPSSPGLRGPSASGLVWLLLCFGSALRHLLNWFVQTCPAGGRQPGGRLLRLKYLQAGIGSAWPSARFLLLQIYRCC